MREWKWWRSRDKKRNFFITEQYEKAYQNPSLIINHGWLINSHLCLIYLYLDDDYIQINKQLKMQNATILQ